MIEKYQYDIYYYDLLLENEKIELSIEDIVNIFNNNIDEKLDRKINFKIDNFFINAFFGYNINL